MGGDESQICAGLGAGGWKRLHALSLGLLELEVAPGGSRRAHPVPGPAPPPQEPRVPATFVRPPSPRMLAVVEKGRPVSEAERKERRLAVRRRFSGSSSSSWEEASSGSSSHEE